MINCIYWCPLIFFIIVINKLHCDFRISIRIECIALSYKFLFQFLIILNDTVMYCYNISIIASMRMSIIL